MSLKTMYNQIASDYSAADRFGAITKSHALAIQQIRNKTHLSQSTSCQHVLDFGVGDGAFLKQIPKFLKRGHYTGIDISPQMLVKAKENLPELICIEGSSAHASSLLPKSSQDLVLAHFINAYIPIPILFEQAAALLQANGYFSLITTTYDSFPVAQQYLADFILTKSLLSRVVGHYYKSITKNTTVALNQAVLLSAFDAHQFDIVAHERLHIPIILNNLDELEHFGIEGTWFINTLNINVLPRRFLIQRIKQVLEKIFTFPYQDTHVIDVVLAKKRL